MPTAPSRRCASGHVLSSTDRACPSCRKDLDRRRGTQTARGYDFAWLQLRDWYRERHPLCERCESRGRLTPMRDVDHVIPFHGRDDLRRLDPDNLQSLCGQCHREKTIEDRHRGLVR